MVISFKYKFTLFSHTRHRKHAWKHSVEVHPRVLDAHWRRKSLPRAGRPPSPPPILPPIRHMVWSMFGSGELLATIMEKHKQRSWQLEYSMMLNLLSRLSLTALALWMRKHWRYEYMDGFPWGWNVEDLDYWPGPGSHTFSVERPFLINSKNIDSELVKTNKAPNL